MTQVFISYRRDDSNQITSRIYDRLVDVFGVNNVFKDVDNIPPGKDFRGVLREAISRSDIMLVIIGSEWLGIIDTNGKRRLDDPEDFVRLEIEDGLSHDKLTVIPVLVENARMPSESDLPTKMRQLAFNNAFTIQNDPYFHVDMDRLVKQIRSGRRQKNINWKWLIGVVFIPIFAAIITILPYLSENWLSDNGTNSNTINSDSNLCNTILPSRIEIGQQVEVRTPGDGINMYETYNVDSDLIAVVSNGDLVSIVDGYVCEQSAHWWFIEYFPNTSQNLISGWVPEAVGNDYYLAPIE